MTGGLTGLSFSISHLNQSKTNEGGEGRGREGREREIHDKKRNMKDTRGLLSRMIYECTPIGICLEGLGVAHDDEGGARPRQPHVHTSHVGQESNGWLLSLILFSY